MKFSNSLTSSIIFYLGLVNPLKRAKASSSTEDLHSSDISLVEFQGLLYTEINNEIEVVQQAEESDDFRLRGRFLREEDVPLKAQGTWSKVVEHGWQMSHSFKNNYYNGQTRNRSLEESSNGLMAAASPFLVCSHSSRNKSAFQRLESMLRRTGALSEDATVVRNDPKKTCYHVSLKHEEAQKLRESIVLDNDNDYYRIAPLADLMKIQVDTMNEIAEDIWTVPTKHSPGDWERLIRVGLSAGHRMHLNEEKVKSIADRMIKDIRSLGQTGAQNRRRRLQEGNTSKQSLSLSDMFSQTASKNKEESRNLRRAKQTEQDLGRLSDWTHALEEGLEADHSCQTMFNRLDVNVHYDNKGFDIVLNPSTGTKNNHHNDGIEYKHDNDRDEEIKNGVESSNDGIEKQSVNRIDSSASNTHCVVSFIMALSTHPLVLSVETEGPIITSDYESQWITQSKTTGKRPLRDLGIDGTNQIISIIDSGLDINHHYFGPTDSKVFDEWDHTQRKVVRYDHSYGDIVEPKGGHGTKVAGAAAGALNNADNEANGIAEGAKLHMYDIQQGSGGYRMPNAYTFFESMHNTDGRHARVANGSWNTRYRAYPFSCKFFDEALHETFQGDLFVASAGNEGLDDSNTQSKERTIGNPASCKNTLAVGASQSHGDRIGGDNKGMDYLAAFSSRGPTYDGRMKPDLVAPGASVLTAYAHENGKTVQAYGTSFSGPVVAGNAALVRQYFEEGKLPCTWGNCKIDPSGSLVKAVLLNSAQNLKQVQVSRPWMPNTLLEEVSEYDNNQGMGLVQLDQTLPIPGHNKFHAIVRNNKVIADGKFHDIYIRATPGKCWDTSYKHVFSATLTWYDPAGASSCAKCLVNDLDIMVDWITSTGQIKANSKQFPNGTSRKDYENNVERVRFNMLWSRRYRIRIHAANLVSATTKFSMIASGCFKVIKKPGV